MQRSIMHRINFRAGRKGLALAAVVTMLAGSTGGTGRVIGEMLVAQAVGFHCYTPQFVCAVPPSLLGTICFCGPFQGVVVP